MDDRSVMINFVDIYGDIISKYSSNNIKDIIMRNWYFHKLKVTAKKFKKANVPINKDTLMEYVLLIYSTFIPQYSFGHINHIKVYDEENGEINFKIEDKNYKTRIEMPMKGEKFRAIINITDDTSNKNYDINLKELNSDNKEINNILYEMNRVILNDMFDYVINLLHHINMKKKGKQDV